MERVAEISGIDDFEVLATLKGSEFEFMTAKHPLIDRDSVLILGDHVTLDAGTGCVHTAPATARRTMRSAASTTPRARSTSA